MDLYQSNEYICTVREGLREKLPVSFRFQQISFTFFQDITPLIANKVATITLYDKDLSDGVNLLIGMLVIKSNVELDTIMITISCFTTRKNKPEMTR